LKLFKLVERREIFRSTGTQVNQIRTLSTLFAISTAYPQIMERAAALLHLPDALNFLLTGEKRTEYSVASISMAFNNVTRCWNYNLLKKVGIKDSIFQKVVPSGTIVGRTNIEKVKNGPLVVSVCSHDTMNAFLAIPSPRGSRRAFISCGTMALISVERDKSDITDKAYTTEYGNNGGFEGKIGFTRSIAGLWIYEKVKEEYERGEGLLDYRLLDSEVQAASSFSSFIDPDNALFFPPGEMTSRIDFFCRKTGQAMPSNRGAYFRCILESLAIKYRIALENLEEILGYKLEALHVVGGGSKNQLLMQNIADATGSPVYTGPVEATAAGNLAIQLYAAGECRNRWEIKEIIARSFPLKEFLPKNKEIWQEACFKFKTIIIEETNFIEGDKT
jgi:sugar (pentulose or hexulose) kinase